MGDGVILLVEDNRDDEELTLRALTKSNILNRVVVARDGAEALDYLFARGAHAARPPKEMPEVVLLDLKLPKVDGLEVLRQHPRRRAHAPVAGGRAHVVRRAAGLVRGYSLGANSYVRKPVDFNQFMEAARQLGLYWLVLNQRPPIG